MLPDRVEERDIAGGLLGEPVQLVKCETVDLEVPANSEIVLEGYILPGERRTEGPFGEYMGYEAGRSGPRPVFHVTCITHRRDPILTVSNMGMPIHESQVVMGITMAGDIYDHLTKQGLPVKMAYMPPYGVTHMIAISTETPFMNFAKRVAHSVWGTKAGSMVYYVIVCDSDVDVTNFNEVIHAVATKCHPVRGIHQVPHAPSYAYMIPYLDAKERPIGDGAYLLLDCTWPKDWPKEVIPVKSCFDVLWPKEIQEKVLFNWEKYGFPEA
jgi:4-hydroxy-3-polyprenylbenzoate decarboxylase